MNKLFADFKSSAKELQNVKSLSICAMMLALRVVVGYFSNLTLTVTPNAKVGFAFLPVAIVGILCGPVFGMIVGALGDILSFIVAPMGAYFFGWTLNGLLVGMVYGLFLYNSPKRPLLSLIICEIIINFFIEVPLGALWLYIQFDKAFLLMAGTRAIKCLIAVPVETIIILIFSKVLRKIPYLNKRKKG